MSGTCRVVLVGMMGSGKTVVGRLLAKRTGWPLLDNDELVLRLFEATPRQILESSGEIKLREAESEALAMGLEAPAPSIVGVAAGTILDEENRRQLRAVAPVVWLRASPATIERRAMGAAHRPWLETGGAAWIETAVRDRDPLFASVADLTLDSDRSSPSELVRTILARLREMEACGPWLPRRSGRRAPAS